MNRQTICKDYRVSYKAQNALDLTELDIVLSSLQNRKRDMLTVKDWLRKGRTDFLPEKQILSGTETMYQIDPRTVTVKEVCVFKKYLLIYHNDTRRRWIENGEITENTIKAGAYIHWAACVMDDSQNWYSNFAEYEIGNSVFYTREAALTALRGEKVALSA